MTSYGEHGYLDLVAKVLRQGSKRQGRNGGTRALFGEMLKFDLSAGFPLLTTKRVFWKGVVAELLWMLSGSTNVADLHKHGVHIWDEWARADGSLGPVYGRQWRAWDGKSMFHDQVADVIRQLYEMPASRRMLVSAWNVADLPDMALSPCVFAHQVFVADGRLDLIVYQRSADVALGLPFDIAEGALLAHLYALEVGLQPGMLTMMLGDAHVYDNHVEGLTEQLTRYPRPFPVLHIVERGQAILPESGVCGCGESLSCHSLSNHSPAEMSRPSYEIGDFLLEGYDPWPVIPMEVSK